MTVHVRHHAFLQFPFGNMVYRAESFGKEVPSVHFILPLTGRIGTFRRFMKNFEDVCLKRRENAKLLVVYFPSVTSAREHKTVMKDYQTRYPEADLLWLEAIGDFSRGLALSLGANQFDQSALLFFCDVDLVFNAEFLYRARTNTILGQQVYYPMVFSQFDPEITYPNRTAPNNQFTVNRDAGFWRAYAFGIVAVYNHDLRVVGGFDTTIQGWGLEDVDLYEKFVRHQDISVFRAADPGLVHVYHPVICDPKLVDRQYAMCQGSKASGFGSEKSLVRHMLSKGYINR